MTDSSSESIQEVPIRDESIRLGQLLKLVNLVQSGSDAKHALASGEILVNDEVETRRGRTLRPGDRVTHRDVVVRVKHDSELKNAR
ncbi:MAG TPA: RNA-binding S4 domain-containing protein [Acidimicrobiales bacterium]|nr:RNA-binding S4 domain-containing protein [Acidimicrobiales bacterium]